MKKSTVCKLNVLKGLEVERIKEDGDRRRSTDSTSSLLHHSVMENESGDVLLYTDDTVRWDPLRDTGCKHAQGFLQVSMT